MMAESNTSRKSASDVHRETALHHAQNLDNQKSMQNEVLDLVVEIVDLPSKQDADPARPSASDAAIFKKGLRLFQVSDLDDVVLERNIYDKCGYGLCGRPNLKQPGNFANRIIWGKKNGPAFQIIPKSELEKWCSKACEERAMFVRLQLGREPAWLREEHVEDVKLLDDVRQESQGEALTSIMSSLNIQDSSPDIADDLKKLMLGPPDRPRDEQAASERLKELSLERGGLGAASKVALPDRILEKATTSIPKPPQQSDIDAGAIEGYQPRPLASTRGRESKDGSKRDEDERMSLD